MCGGDQMPIIRSRRVIDSCVTLEQIKVACKYCLLELETVRPERLQPLIWSDLAGELHYRRQVILQGGEEDER